MKSNLLLTKCLGMLLALGCLAREAQAQKLVAHNHPAAAQTYAAHQQTTQSLEQVLDRLEKQYGVNFAYERRLLTDKTVAASQDSADQLEVVLQRVLRPLQLTFTKVDNVYVIQTSRARDTSVKKVAPRSPDHVGFIADSDAPGMIETLPDRLTQTTEQVITGQVTDQSTGETLPGVNILVKGTTIGTITDVEGSYRLTAPDDAETLVFSSVGYTSQEVTIDNQTVINLEMEPDVQALSEVVVVGYGAVKKSDLTGSVSQISSEDINAFPIATAEEALRGRASGVRVTQNSAAPGSRIQIQIRGGNSLLASNEPLFVVDGFPLTGGIDYLNPSDIESINVLKDASATAIYGSRGANGVVLVTTKQGSSGKGTITAESYYGIQEVRKKFDLMNARQYAEIANEYAASQDLASFFDVNDLGGIETDWQDAIFQSAPIQNHSLGFQGGNETTKYFISGNYFSQEGIVVNSGARRGSVDLRLDQEVNDWLNIATNLTLSRLEFDNIRGDNANRGTGALSAAWVSPPLLAPYTDGELTDVAQFGFSPNVLQNPLAWVQIKNQQLSTRLVGNLVADIELAEGLVLKVLGGTEQGYRDINYYSPSILNGTPTGNARTTTVRELSYLNENTLNYQRKLRQADQLSVTAGFTLQEFDRKRNQSEGSGFANDILTNNNLGSAETIFPNVSDVTEWTLLSWLGRVNYTLNDKYLFTASVRADGSSRFGDNNKWSVFPSGAVAWRLSDEEFIKNIGAISNLKLRASYGLTGNTAIDPYQSLDRLGDIRATFGKTDVIGFAPSDLANPDLRWETTAQFDLGLDLGLVDERLRVTLDYYRKTTNDLLANVPLPTSLGFRSFITNLGEIRNTGVEVSVGADILVDELTWSVMGQASFNRNEVVDIGGEDVFGADISQPFANPVNIVREGEPLGVFYGFVENGLDEDGFIQYQDIDGEEGITNEDRTIIGNPYPDFIYSLNSDLSYKNFSLNIFFEGVQGNDLFFATGGSLTNSFNRGENQLVEVYNDHWTVENPNPNAKYPRISPATRYRASDRFIQDGSYLRLRNVRLAYNLPTANLGIGFLRSLQVYVSGQNLLTFTNYVGLEPEVNTRGDAGDLRVGVDETAYPSAKIYTAGVKLGL